MKLIINSNCRLISAPEEIKKEIEKRLTIANPVYTKAHIYGRSTRGIKKFLFFFTKDETGISFPRGFAFRVIKIIKNQKIDLQVVNQTRLFPQIEFTFSGILREYQQKAENRSLEKRFGVLVAPTGSGKTVMGISIICKRQQPTLILVHTKELLYQWESRIKTFTGIECGLIGDNHFEIKKITVGIVNSVKNKIEKLFDKFGHLVVDECHRVPSTTFTEVVTKFDCAFMLGLSATSYRRDEEMTKLIYIFLGPRILKINQKELEESGQILKPEYIKRVTDFYFNSKGDYHKLMNELTNNLQRNLLISSDIIKEKQTVNGVILVVSDRVYHCKLLKGFLEKKCNVELLTGETKNRSEIIERVKSGKVDVLISTIQLIGEGFDCPGLNSLFLTTPIKFIGRLRQVIGRIIRPADGKKAKVFDYIDNNVDMLLKSAIKREKELED